MYLKLFQHELLLINPLKNTENNHITISNFYSNY